MALMALDLPALERPAKATSAPASGGNCAGAAALIRNRASSNRLIESYMDAYRFCEIKLRVVGVEVTAAVLHSAFVADLTSAGPDEIRREKPHLLKGLEVRDSIQAHSLRSNLFRHHMDIYPRNLWRSASSLM